MKKFSGHLGSAFFLMLFAISSSMAQGKQQAPQPSQPSGGNRPSVSQPPSQGQFQGPLYVEGRVVADNGQPASAPVSVKLSCGSTTVQTIKTDPKGYFRFTLGLSGPQSNFDLGAADESSSPFGGLGSGSGS